MNGKNKIRSPFQAETGAVLEDLVYRVSLSEDNRWMRGAAARVTVPLTLGVLGILGGLAFLGARPVPAEPTTIRTVGIVLQEGPDSPAPAAGPASARPASAPALVQPPAPAPAPAPPRPMELSPPPRNADQAAPATVPAALPQEDHSRDYGSAAGTGSGGMSTGSGGTGTGSGGTGTGAAGSGGGTSRILDLDFSLVRPKYRPPAPAYPPLARNAGVQGEVAVQITIGPDGVPVSAHAAAGPQQLRAAAETNSLAWRFYPYLQDGTPQFCRFLVTFTFRIK